VTAPDTEEYCFPDTERVDMAASSAWPTSAVDGPERGPSMYHQTRPEQEETGGLDRRTLLRTGGAAVVAGVAGLAVAETVTAASAGAAAGSPLVLGTANDSGTTPTSVTSAATTSPTFSVANTGGVAPLHLTEEAFPASFAALTSGDLANFGGDLFYTAGTAAGPLTGFVYSEFTANQLVTIKPQRILDSRTVAGRAHITNPAGNLDSAGRLLAGHTIVITLSSLEVAAAAAFCNLTAVGPLTGSFMTLWPGGTRPATSSLNFAANAIIANFAVTGTSASDTVSIFSAATTHVLLDITAFAVGNPGQVNPAILASARLSATSQRLAARAKAGTLPDWYAAR
jgi:hypothetical protein